jgi:hypothetical protein
MARRNRRHLTDEEVDALRELVHGRRPSPIGAYAALVAAIATLLSAVTASVLAVVDALRP